jgi:hypothetical protein
VNTSACARRAATALLAGACAVTGFAAQCQPPEQVVARAESVVVGRVATVLRAGVDGDLLIAIDPRASSLWCSMWPLEARPDGSGTRDIEASRALRDQLRRAR